MESLRCFDRISIEDPTLFENGIATRYLLWSGPHIVSTRLLFRYERPILDPHDPLMRNLARLIVTMPVINYGLFSDAITLHFPLEAVDVRMVEAMLENTAREIYLNKILGENPFLLPEYRPAAFVKPDRFCRAVLQVDGVERLSWKVALDPTGYAVSSSGGKESLLSYGMLNEIGLEPHCCFFNESGRHWYTALNAYRYFKANVPRTWRVWSNVDRLYNFVLRHLKIIRRDFHRVRADIYPIRLFTVEVMAAAFLPILYRERIGHLVIGNEFDTTQYSRSHGVTHYDMVYDQSRDFDDYMTRYFRRKGFPIRQCSIVRPLSELLIERILGRRYPDLFRLQTSCHAAHLDGNRTLPCGRCEKCQRVMALTIANDLDPTVIGYRNEDILLLAQRLKRTRLRQEGAAVRHLCHLLWRRNPEMLPGNRPPRSHPEIEHLRFDREHSPLNAIPPPIRGPVLRIMLKYAEGIVRRRGRRWIPCDLQETLERGREDRGKREEQTP